MLCEAPSLPNWPGPARLRRHLLCPWTGCPLHLSQEILLHSHSPAGTALFKGNPPFLPLPRALAPPGLPTPSKPAAHAGQTSQGAAGSPGAEARHRRDRISTSREVWQEDQNRDVCPGSLSLGEEEEKEESYFPPRVQPSSGITRWVDQGKGLSKLREPSQQ